MELWEKVILEWINCLEVQDKPVTTITELQDGVFYINFLKLIKWKKLQKHDQEDFMKFIKEEYPSFKVNKDDNAEDIYIASLLLLHLCRTLHQSLQYNMCDNLRIETQIRVKTFLENVLPIGKDITKETMRDVIMEVEDTSTVVDNLRTPPIEDFSKSPLTHSGRSIRIMTERARELRDLRSSLAIERFTNTDLRDDISRQHNKIKKLQKKLDEKSAKIKELREERMKPSTPQPSQTKENNSQEDYYKRYINDLENQLSKMQDEFNKLEIEKDNISKELCCTRRTSKHYKENFENYERSLESLSSKIELKDRELIDLRMHNEELRVHIKELNKNANLEQSFEIEDVSFPVTKSLNTSEVLSSVIEIQLQEAKEESAILHAQVDSLKGRLDFLTKDYKNVMELNRDLQQKIKRLDRVQEELNHIKKELDVSNTTVTGLEAEKLALVTQVEDLKNILSSREKRLSEVEQSNVVMSTKLSNLELDMQNLNELLENEKLNSSNLNTTLTETKLQVTEHLACIHKLTSERDSYKSSIENCTTSLRDILHCNKFIKDNTDNLNNSTLSLTKRIEIMLHNCNKEIEIKEQELLKLQTKMHKLASEANTTEKKMKEIIINLQEIRSSQDAVLTTQEATLKEKCLYIEELQERFDDSKKVLNKELEDAKSSLHEYQIKFFDLENQLNNQNRVIKELQNMLKIMSAELETSKEYCKNMDANQTEIIKLCQELEHPTKNLNSTITETCSDFDLHDVPQCINIDNKYKRINIDNNANILNIIKMTIDELHKSQKVISHLSCANIELNKTLVKQKVLMEDNVKNKEEVCSLKNKIRELEIIAQKRNNYLKSLIKNKELLKDFLKKVFAMRNDLDTILTSSTQKWNEILAKFQNIFHIESSVCEEFKQLQIKKTNLESILLKCQIDYSENIKVICDILWEKFLWTEQKLHDTYLCSIHEKECLDVLTNVEENQFFNEKIIIDTEFEKYKTLEISVIKSKEEIESFTASVIFYENSLKSGEIKNHVEIEKKLESQINQLTKEKKDFKTKLDTIRSRNVKLERNIDELRTEIRKLKSTETVPMETNLTVSEGTEVQSLKEELERLKEENQQLHGEKDESDKTAKQKFENQLKEIHATYEKKLEDMKQQMKTAYNEQMTKLNKEQERIVQEKLQNQMEIMCQKQREELNRYKAHVGELSSQLWNVGEKLLIEQQQKHDTLQRLKNLEIKVKESQANQPIATISRKTCTIEKQEMLPENIQANKITTLITEETLERRHSIRSMQTMGNVFKSEDEEEIFDNVYLADIKRGNFAVIADTNRLSVLQMRNSLCKPHLKSSYPAEMQFLPATLTEEEIKTGSSVEENFNDSLSQSLLPEQKTKKKDRSQISYKKPGPPTPSKNGGRLSLQNNELRSPSSRVLRERNVDRKASTPHSLKNIFSLKRQDESTFSSPKGRRLSNLFRKSRLQSDR